MDYQTLGLTHLQADVIAALLEAGGEASAPTIIEILSKTQNINRTSIYSILSKLEQRGVIISSDGRSANYSLISTRPAKIINHLLNQQQQEVSDFTTKLNEAKSKQQRGSESEFYSLRSKQQVIDKINLMVEGTVGYCLIMANTPIMKIMEPLINRLGDEQKKGILVIPTWNPDPNIDMNKMVEAYRDILDSQHVSDPLPIFSRVVPMMRQFLDGLGQEFQKISPGNAFVMVLTQDEWIMASYLLGDIPLASGIYSREPNVGQMLHLLYMTIFEYLSDLDQEIVDGILQQKISTVMQNLVDHL